MGAMIGGAGGGRKAGSSGDSGPGAARFADAALLAVAMGMGLVLCVAESLSRRGSLDGAGPWPDPSALAHRVDLRTAGTDELQLLPGVGARLAERIAAERAARGPFASPEDVDRRVPGIGPARVRSWRGRIAGPGEERR